MVKATEKYLRLFITILLFLAVTMPVKSQFYNGTNMTFGKNRVQYRQFFWTYYRFDDFDTYFYLNGKNLAIYLSKYADKEIPLMEDKLGIGLSHKIKFIVFNNLSDFKQSNIGLYQENEENSNVGGTVKIIGSRVMVYFDGNYKNFEKQIRSAIAQVLVNDLFFGASLGQQVKSSIFGNLPGWYTEGLISYLAEDWDVDIDNKVRDGILSGRYKKLKNLSGDDAVVAGHSLWRFIAERYGKATISNIIMMTGSSSNVKKGFLYVLGIPYKTLLKEWRDFYVNEYSNFLNNKNEPLNKVKKIKHKEDVVYYGPHINPQGNILAYVANERGKYKLFVYDLIRNKKRRLFKRGTLSSTKTDYSFPVMAWHPNGKILAFEIERKGLLWLFFYDFEHRKFIKRRLYEVQKVTDMSYSDDGQTLVMSAVEKGKPDIFLYNVGASSFERITNDFYTDLNPSFINNSTKIVFSSNRLSDTLGVDMPENMTEQPSNFDLFVYDYKSGNKILKRITKTPLANEIQPEEVSKNTISYLSDESGIYNAYMASVDSAVESVDTVVHYRYFVTNKVLTNYNRNIIEQHVSKQSHKKAMVFYKDGYNYIYTEDVPGFNEAESVKPTYTKYMLEKKREYNKLLAKLKKHNSRSREEKIEEPVKRKFKRFEMVYVDENGNEVIGKPKKEKVIKIDANGQLLVVDEGENSGKPLEIPIRRNYYTQYYIDNMVTQVDFTYLNQGYQPFTGQGGVVNQYPGFNMNFKLGITDLMNDHRLMGGVRFNFSLLNNEYLASYSDQKKRLDKEIIFHRNTIEGYGAQYQYINVHTHEVFYKLKWPFNEALSIRGTFHLRNDAYVTTATDMISLTTPTYYENWGGFIASLVYDDSRSLGLNLHRGWRWKIFAEYNQLLKKGLNNLIVFGFDFRNYLRIHRNFIWANRLAGSASMGNHRLLYYMGGVDNWIAPKYDHTLIDPRVRYGFQTLATNMRGHYQNVRNGSNFILINSELRFPVFQYFSQAPLSSQFLRSFQVVTFGDVGTAWTGVSPFAPFTYFVDSGPYHITVEVQKEPVVAGFGFGARAYLLGYFVRGDVAWGIEDGKIVQRVNKKGRLSKAPVFYFSLNLDF